MSEKRFIVETVAVREKVITDKEKCYSYEDLDEIVDKLNEQQATIKRLQKHLDYEMEEHTEKTFEMLEFMKEKGVFDEYYERVKKGVLDDE